MPHHNATVSWTGGNPSEFAKGHYRRVHEWAFDGGQVVKASSSPSVVREPWSDPYGVDPEEALVASVSSCHMLWFLDLARQAGHVVTSYVDEADGTLEKCDDGKLRMSLVTLRPAAVFDGEGPGQAALDALHRAAHDRCFIANSITADVIVEAR